MMPTSSHTSNTTMTPQSPPQPSLPTQIADAGKSLYAQRRPWSELISASNGGTAFAKPDSFGDALARIRRNAAYFRINYAFLLLLMVLCSLLKEPVALLVIVTLAAAWCLLYLFRTEPLVVFDRSLSDGAVLAGLTLGTILALFLTGVTGTILMAVAVGALIVALHGAFRVTDDLFIDEEEAAQSGLLGHSYTAIASNPRQV
ncbi:hypothetical protein SUGI_0090460 [Cryptomeria japonica]|uniref:PRA1 family protein B2 n=1 Tax=Cryptomeria japonica TaxID=3369 RepID=UPI00240892AE|nr:PRA1 family protein B2 [Cryptomeria japonica]GLJ08525.1 hypothetical protein SUGI_0090460 [Cryptomeria japonica]